MRVRMVDLLMKRAFMLALQATNPLGTSCKLCNLTWLTLEHCTRLTWAPILRIKGLEVSLHKTQGGRKL